KLVEESGLLAMPQLSAMLRNTLSLNVMKAGSKTNVIPSLAEADLDARLLPGQEIDAFIETVREKLADDEIEVDIITATKDSESTADTDDYRRILGVLGDRFPESIITPWLMIGTSDSRFFREKGIPCYGVCPVLIPMDYMKMIHGIDEQISVENMVKGTEIFREIVRTLCV
ncbi:MAG: M20/M25/M40 family metallo-hydrolase, partial [Proteobacteria bacterium]|nr:M20/M25/M40 family metallo-hydrolase [Pseudomonadota bacterium]